MISDAQLLDVLAALLESDRPVHEGIAAAIREAVCGDRDLSNALAGGFTDAELEAIRVAANEIRGAR